MLIVFSVCLAIVSSAQLRCDYQATSRGDYYCIGEIKTTASDYTVEDLIGDHADGKGNDDLTGIFFGDVPMEVMPQNVAGWFNNIQTLGLLNTTKLQAFKRSDFTQYSQLKNFLAGGLTSITKIPKDTFWDLTKLTNLTLDDMPNMEDLDEDLLMNARSLVEFTAQGPNKMTQIGGNFLRSQTNTLQVIIITDTNLTRIGFSTFENLPVLTDAVFVRAGCLDRWYRRNIAATITADVRADCLDVSRTNDIMKKPRNGPSSSSSSSSSDSSESH